MTDDFQHLCQETRRELELTRAQLVRVERERDTFLGHVRELEPSLISAFERVRVLEDVLRHALGLCLQPAEDFDEADSEWCHNQRAALSPTAPSAPEVEGE